MTSPSPSGEPYRVRLHYDPTREGVHVGLGQRMDAACGQVDWIGTTNDPDKVECLKCLNKINPV